MHELKPNDYGSTSLKTIIERTITMLNNIKTLQGNHIQASDGEVGHIDDFNIDEETWPIRYLIIDTLKWLTGNKSDFTTNDRAQ